MSFAYNPGAYYMNVLVNFDGTISPMSFDTRRQGVWHFDGQIFYQRINNV